MIKVYYLSCVELGYERLAFKDAGTAFEYLKDEMAEHVDGEWVMWIEQMTQEQYDALPEFEGA